MPGGTDQTLRPLLWRAARLYPDREIVSRTHEGITRYEYETYEGRVAKLANALSEVVDEGDRVATFCWNHHRHFETYFAVPSMGAQLHTINPLLPDVHVQYIVENAEDRVVFVDPSLAEKLAAAYDDGAFESVEQFVVMGESADVPLEPAVDYESFVDDHSTEYDWPVVDQDQPAGLCYTSGTTGKPKGVEYTQGMLWAHTMATLPQAGLDLRDTDVVMPVVPMFHVNAWGLPFSTTAAGAKHVYPGPAPEPADLASLIEEEGVTVAAGVPTVWLGLLEYVQENDVPLSSLERVVVGGAAAPESLIRAYGEMGIDVIHAWGMTEMSPLGTVSNPKAGMEDWGEDRIVEKRKKQGLLVPGLEMKVVDDDGDELPWDGEQFGELLVRGPWVTTEYFGRPDATESDFEDDKGGRWLRTGDVVTIDPEGYVEIVDRAKDVIKSGGEWISSQTVENALMAHEDVSEATVIGVPHERWQERPVAFVVPGDDVERETLSTELVELVESEYPTWWAPDEVLFIDEVPKTATGKFDKKVLREEYADEDLLAGTEPEGSPEE